MSEVLVVVGRVRRNGVESWIVMGENTFERSAEQIQEAFKNNMVPVLFAVPAGEVEVESCVNL